MTGASEKTLRRTEAEYEKIYIHPTQHAGYYPGAASMTIKLLFRPSDGRVLGGQIVGGEGVDKRIDVLAMAVQAGMTVYDLEEAELAYAPQFGSAKDPINMAGFVAANVLRGDVDIVHADELDPDAVLVDVRDPAEHEAGAIGDSLLIPLNELRQRHAQLPKDKPIITYCQVGQRGYIAARILGQLAYSVRNLSGGYRTYRAYFPETETNGANEGGGANEAAGKTAAGARPSKSSMGNSMPASGLIEPGERKTTPAKPKSSSACATEADQTLDVRGQPCPGPIVAIGRTIESLGDGQVLRVLASDVGFASDVPAWCERTGHGLVDVRSVNGHVEAWIRKGSTQPRDRRRTEPARRADDKTIVVFSNELDRVLAALVIANGAAAMGRKVTLFFTFWGLSVLRRSGGPQPRKGLMDRMFGWMLPRGVRSLPLSRWNLGGTGAAMLKRVMKRKNVASPAALLEQARAAGVTFVACAMSLDVMGIRPEELIDGVEIGGVAAYLAAADEANANLFV